MNNENQNTDNNIKNANTITTSRLSLKNIKKIKIEFGEKNENLINNKKFGNNEIKTTKYNVITLIPKNLFYQLCRASNIYFLIVCILNCLSFSPKEPVSMIITFAFVLIFTMGKDAFLDYGRHIQDKKSNSRICHIFMNNKWKKEKCFKIIPGNIIKIKEDEECSCDILIIKSSNLNGYLFVDTKNLDGESNLKEKYVIENLKNEEINDEDLSSLSGNIITTSSDENLNEWEGQLNYNNLNAYCTIDNIMLKGTILKNTKFIYGIVVYAGHQTKIMKNSHKPEPKTSKMIKTMDKLLYSLFSFTLLLCLVFAFLCNKFEDDYGNKYDYIFINANNEKSKNKPVKILIYFIIFFIDYYQIIPISLYVCMEIIKIYQNILLYYDFEMYDLKNDKPAESRESGLLEQLGQIDFLFSDKTGTLTMNQMEFKKCFINGKIYGAEKESNECTDAPFSINGDMSAYELLTGNNQNEKQEINIKEKNNINKDRICVERFFLLICVCNDVYPTIKNDKICYQSTSPDDTALVRGAQQLGYEFQIRDYSNLIIKNYINHNIYNFEAFIFIPFSSDRKRMTILVRDIDKEKYYIFSKGSDSVMISDSNGQKPLITIYNDDKEKKKLERILEYFSKEGLRILVMGYKEIDKEQANNWKNRYVNSMKINFKKSEIFSEIEKDLIFCGCSAIEDKLQEGVPETIKTLMDCGIRIWVLTGDKKETAIQISKQCNLIEDKMTLYDLTKCKNEFNLIKKLNNLCEKYKLKQYINVKNINLDEILNKIKNDKTMIFKDIAFIIDGFSLQNVIRNKELGRLFFLLAIISKSVICCRISPKQKSSVVDLIKSNGDFITLAIGDGANDIPMIMEASVGVGIQGKEGTQAVRSSDYSLGQFKFLEKLILFYGRNGYTKIAKYISYYFYKNFILVVTELIFAFYNGFSGQIFFPDWYGTLFNAVFTSWPCIFVFAYEKELSVKICKKFPVLYRAGPKNYHFNLKTFWIYIIYGLVHSILCFIIPAYSLRNIINKKGDTMNSWKISTVSFSMIIHVVSIKLLLISNFWNWFSIIFTILSIFLYYIIIICLCSFSIGSQLQPESLGAISFIMHNIPSVIIIILGPFIVCLPDIIIKQIKFSFFPNPAEYLIKFQNNKDYLKILEDKNISTNHKGKVIIHKVSRRFTQGVKNLQERIQEIRKANSTVDVNLINKLKLDISSNSDLQENSINPLNNIINNRLLPLNRIKRQQNNKAVIEKQKTNKNYEDCFQNIKRNSLEVYQGPNDIVDSKQ